MAQVSTGNAKKKDAFVRISISQLWSQLVICFIFDSTRGIKHPDMQSSVLNYLK